MVGGECVALAAGPVHGDHQLCVGLFVERVLPGEGLQVGDELDVFAEEEGATKERAVAAGATANSAAEDDALTRAATSAVRRRIAAQSSLFDLANQKIVDELRETKVEEMSAEEAKELLAELRKKVM